jgi:hypothetical protein
VKEHTAKKLDRAAIQALAARFLSPRCYADPAVIQDSMQQGIMFNIIDTTTGVKADLAPVTYDSKH